MRKILTILLAVAALGVLASCGTSGGSDGSSDKKDATTTVAPKETTTTEAAMESVAVAEWADGFCGSFSTWLDDIKGASDGVADGVTPGDVPSAQTAMADLFGTASSATQTLITELDDAGAPDIEDGDQLVADLIDKFEAFDAAAQEAKTEIEGLSTDDLDTFQTEADKLTTQFQDEVQTVADSFGEIDTKYPSTELSTELNKACDF